METYSSLTNAKAKHDNKDGPCKCGAWHNPKDDYVLTWIDITGITTGRVKCQ